MLLAVLAQGAAFFIQALAIPAFAQTPLPLPVAAQLAAERAPMVNKGTLLAFAYRESRLHPFAVHDNVTGQSLFPASAVAAADLARARLAMGHSLDLGIMQVNSANLARTGLTVTTAFDAGESMRAGALILTAAYRQCLRGSAYPTGDAQQAALRCAASVYNTGRKQAGILNGYQADVWRAAAMVVPAIQFGTAGTVPSRSAASDDVVAPEPRRSPPLLEDALHATPPVPDAADGLTDALHLTSRKGSSMKMRLPLSLAVLAAFAVHPATAVSVTGGIDPTTGLQTLGSWILSLVGVAIPIICAFKGTHAVAEGRHLAPYIGSAIGGMVLAFGGAYILTHYGVT